MRDNLAMNTACKLCLRISVLFAFSVLLPCALTAQVPEPSSQKASDVYDAGMRLLREKRYAEALEQFQQEEKIAPKLPQGATGEGIALALLGRLPEAQQALGRALQIDPTDWMPRRELGIVEWQLNEKDQAAKDLAEIVKLFPTDGGANSVLGQYEWERGNYSQAAAYFAAAPAEVAGAPRLRLMNAEALLKTGRLNEAKEQLAGLSGQANLTPDEKVRLGWLLGQSKQYPEAIQVFNSIPKDYPDQPKLRYGLALAYFEQSDYAKCIETLKDYTAPGTSSPAVLSLLGVAEEKAGHTEEALIAFREGIEQFPTDNESYLDLATLGAVHVNYDIPLPALAAGMEKIPGDYKLFLASGLLHNLKGQHDIAQAEYQKALALAPDQASIYVALGMCYEDEDKYSDAVAILQKAVERQIKDVLVYYFLADTLFRQGVAPNTPQYEQAQSAVEAGLRIDPGYAFSYLQRAKLETMTPSHAGSHRRPRTRANFGTTLAGDPLSTGQCLSPCGQEVRSGQAPRRGGGKQ